MTLPSEYTFREPEKLVSDLQNMYRLLRESVEGYTEEFTGVIYGGSTEGVGTYTTNSCYYVRRGVVIDLFCYLDWSGHTGTGDLLIKLPFFEKGFANSVSVSPIRTYNLTWPASSTSVVLTGVAGEDYAQIQGIRTAGTAQTVQIDTSASITFHHRYIGQVEK